MTEINFGRQFLAALDKRAQKLSSDHAVDAKSYPAQSAVSAPRSCAVRAVLAR